MKVQEGLDLISFAKITQKFHSKKLMKLIFMGTPEFAVPSLQILFRHQKNIVAVITAPDKPSGRGLQLVPSPVKIFAEANGIPVLQPEKLKNSDFLRQLADFQADLQIVVAFRMLPEGVWQMPPLGTFNLHASLLPQYRGAAPINWAVANGETETGVTTFFLQHEIDTGKIIFQEKQPILPEDTAGTLYEKLMHQGAELVLKTVNAIESGDYPQTEQDLAEEIKLAPKIFTETCEIDFSQKAEAVHNFVRGMNPFPGAWMRLNGKVCKIFQTRLTGEAALPEAPWVQTDDKTYLHLKTADDWLAVEELQLEGKKRMKTGDFLRGNKVKT
jgi:methionyl-tRNA formyltransferase